MNTFLPSARKLRRLCFYRCVSVHCPREGGWYPSMPCRWYPSMPCSRSLGGCVLSQHALQQVSRGGAWSGGCLLLGWGGVCSWVGEGLLLGGGLVSQHALRQTPPGRDGYCCGRYASHWNAFLFVTSYVLKFLIFLILLRFTWLITFALEVALTSLSSGPYYFCCH